MNAVSAVGVTVATVVRPHPVVAVAVIANAPAAPAGVAVTGIGMVVGMRETVEKNAGGEAGLHRPGTAGGVCPLIGEETTGPEPLPWMMAQK